MKKLTKTAIARHLFMSPQRLGVLITEGTLPDIAALPEIATLDDYRRAYITGLRKTAAGHQSEDGKLDLTAERANLARVQRERIEMENAVTRGELVLGSDVEEMWGSEFTRVKNRLMAFPTKLAPLMIAVKSQGEAHDMLQAVCYEALNELSQPDNG
jgi:hypothetical protein